MKNYLKEIEFRKRRKLLLINTIQDLVKEWVLKKQIAYELWIENTRISKLLKWDIYISEKLVESYLTKLWQWQK